MVHSVSASNSILMIVSRSFYIENRMCLGFVCYKLKDAIPVFKMLDDWEKQNSTKIDTCARMCRHLLT